jgi:hypothetical protein
LAKFLFNQKNHSERNFPLSVVVKNIIALHGSLSEEIKTAKDLQLKKL